MDIHRGEHPEAARRDADGGVWRTMAGKVGSSMKSRQDEVIRRWLETVIDDLDLPSLEAFPSDRVAASFPRLINSITKALGESDINGFGRAETAEAAACLATLRRGNTPVAKLVDDYTLLKRLLVEAAAKDLRRSDMAALSLAARLDDGMNHVFKIWLETYFEQNSRELRHLADTDPLTGLYNVRHFRKQLHRNLEMYKRYQVTFALLMLDLDNFKLMNDTRGHHVGDRVLKHMAEVMMAEKRETDVAVRYGGDEFFLLLPGIVTVEAEHLARRISHRTRQLNITTGGREMTGVSIGVVSCPTDGTDVSTLRQKVDKALRLAKTLGGGTVARHRDFKPGSSYSL